MDLDTWLATCATELEIEDFRLTNETMHMLLDLARDSAHHVTRVSAPLTTFLVGVAVGRGASLSAAAAKTTALLVDNQPEHGTDGS